MSTLTLVHLITMGMFVGLVVLLKVAAENEIDDAILPLYGVALVSTVCNLNGGASLWVSDYAMNIARHDNFGLGVLLAFPYWAAMAATSLFAVALTGLLVCEGLKGAAELALPKRAAKRS